MSLARAEAIHFGRLDAAYQRQLDDEAEREEAIEREYLHLISRPISDLIRDDAIDSALWAAAERRVDQEAE
ncbi:MAG: hypothetical protein GVY22_01790 [Gammaproteobacteria bacterium]|jgi:hypothetical protein|nr:hypothetical protein [Gammaproteobacteria bacterium]